MMVKMENSFPLVIFHDGEYIYFGKMASNAKY
jgi:hypothetical protein